MKNCPNCRKKLIKEAVAFCTNCGHQLVVTDDLPTLSDVLPKKKSDKTIPFYNKSALETENKKLKDKILKLEKTSAVLFGTSEESVDKRAQRILTVSGYERGISGRVSQSFFDERLQDISFRTISIPHRLSGFALQIRAATNDQDDDEIMYIASYGEAVDFEKELADIRVLLAETASKRLPCVFVMATNENLRKHKSLLRKNFNAIRMSIPIKKRSRYTLEIWDASSLLESEYTLKIKVRPKETLKNRRKM